MKTKLQATASTPEAVTVKPVSNLLKAFAGLIILFALLGMAGTAEYQVDVYYSIPEDALPEIQLKAGKYASRSEIIEEYMSDREYYDSFMSDEGSELSQIFMEKID